MRPSSGQRYAASARRQRKGIEMARGKVLWFNPVTRVYPALRWPHGRAGRSACRRARRPSDFETWSKVALRGRAWPEREAPSRNPKADRLMRPPSTSPPRPLVREHDACRRTSSSPAPRLSQLRRMACTIPIESPSSPAALRCGLGLLSPLFKRRTCSPIHPPN